MWLYIGIKQRSKRSTWWGCWIFGESSPRGLIYQERFSKTKVRAIAVEAIVSYTAIEEGRDYLKTTECEKSLLKLLIDTRKVISWWLNLFYLIHTGGYSKHSFVLG